MFEKIRLWFCWITCCAGGRNEMIELIYKCDLCDEKTADTQCCKVYYAGSGVKPTFVHKGSEGWNKTQNGKLVCYSCMKIIKTTSMPN